MQKSRNQDKMRFLPSLRILSYHSISDLSVTMLADYGVPPEQFERQIKLLLQNQYTFLNPGDLIDVVTGRNQIRAESILITFDDCYKDFLSGALPILRRYEIKAIIFPVSRLIGGENVWDNRHRAPKLPLLDVSELLRIQSAGFSIGLHSRTHPHLTDRSHSDLTEEIRGSWEDLTAVNLKPLPILAYPYGAFDEHVKKAARDCGVEAALTVHAGIVQEAGDAFQIPRIEILPTDDGREFLEKVAHLRVAKKTTGSDLRERASKPKEMSDVTLVMLSCGRYDLLDATVRSFMRSNKYPIREVFISEDSGDPAAISRLQQIFADYDLEVTFLIHSRSQGITECKDILYSRVITEFVMHLEDDWLCTSTRGDFIHRAKDVLAANPDILQVCLRPPYDCGQPVEDKVMGSTSARFNLLKTGHRGKWHGYSDNPNLRRKREYVLLGAGGYSSMIKGDSDSSEAAIGQFYFERGFRAAVLVEPDAGFIHIGGARSIPSSPTGSRKRWPSPKSMSELHTELSVAHQRNGELKKEVQEMRRNLETVSEELRTMLERSHAIHDTIEQILRSEPQRA